MKTIITIIAVLLLASCSQQKKIVEDIHSEMETGFYRIDPVHNHPELYIVFYHDKIVLLNIDRSQKTAEYRIEEFYVHELRPTPNDNHQITAEPVSRVSGRDAPPGVPGM